MIPRNYIFSHVKTQKLFYAFLFVTEILNNLKRWSCNLRDQRDVERVKNKNYLLFCSHFETSFRMKLRYI